MNDKKTIGDVLIEIKMKIDDLKGKCICFAYTKKALEKEVKDLKKFKETCEEKLQEFDSHIKYLEQQIDFVDSDYQELSDGIGEVEEAVNQLTKIEEYKLTRKDNL